MKQRLTPPRSTDISVLLPNCLHCFLIFLIFTFIAPVTHSKASSDSDLDQELEHHRRLVEELKSRVLQMMGRTTPPAGYNTSSHSVHGKVIREFFRSKLNTTEHTDSLQEGDIYLSDPQTHVFQSTDPDFMVPVQPADGSSSTTTLTMVKFSTNFQQPELPYHDLLIKSAILRLRITRQKRKLRRKVKLPLHVSVYLLDNTIQSGMSGDHVTPIILRSLTVNTLKSKTIEINIESRLLSHLVESDNKTVTFGIRIHQSVTMVKNRRKTKSDSTPYHMATTTTSKQNNKDLVRISKARLQMTSQTKDLRKARTKRQDDETPTCTGNVCCRHSIYVDFADIGWSDWVLYPAGYTAYYCKGGCPERYKVASSFTNIKSILHEKSPDIVPAPVCAPTGYSHLDMIIHDGQVKDMAYPGMVVTGCRCH